MPAFVILDRDGVINEDSPNYIKSVDEWIPIPGSLQAIAKLTEAGYKVFIATNQAGIGRGKLTLVTLKKIHERMTSEVERFGGKIEDIQFCPHHSQGTCECRKPKPGMLTNLATIHDLDLSQGYFVGDSMKDLLASEAVGCTGVLVLSGNGHQTLKLRPGYEPAHPNLAAFVDTLLAD